MSSRPERDSFTVPRSGEICSPPPRHEALSTTSTLLNRLLPWLPLNAATFDDDIT
jgi:hypothetical protein